MDAARRDKVDERIEALEPEVVDALCRLVEIPSVAGDHDAAERAAAAVVEICRQVGLAAEIWPTQGAPAVFAEVDGPAGAPTLLLYGHYDVQPAEPLAAWTTPPFEPTLRGGALYGRGAGDNKGQFVAHLFAVGALLATGGCPVGVKLLIEGEEEMGSPALPALIEARRDRLACDVALTADGACHAGGNPLIVLGVRGLLYLDASVRGAERDLHSGSHGGTAPAPARALARALGSLWNDDGRVAVPGFYDAVRPPTERELELVRALPAAGAVDGPAAWSRLMFEPNLNIAGMTAGYAGEGVKTVIPHRATAKLDARLVADQDPEEIWLRLRAFLGERGVDTTLRAAVPPSRTAADNPFLEPVRAAMTTAWERAPLVQPCLGGTTPDFVFTRELGVPSLIIPYAPADMCHHAPNEHLRLDALMRGVRTTAAICLQLAELEAGEPPN